MSSLKGKGQLSADITKALQPGGFAKVFKGWEDVFDKLLRDVEDRAALVSRGVDCYGQIQG